MRYVVALPWWLVALGAVMLLPVVATVFTIYWIVRGIAWLIDYWRERHGKPPLFRAPPIVR